MVGTILKCPCDSVTLRKNTFIVLSIIIILIIVVLTTIDHWSINSPVISNAAEVGNAEAGMHTESYSLPIT